MIAGTARTPTPTLYSASTDIELERRLTNFLYQRHVPDVDCVWLDARGGVVVVSGELPSQHAKWLCIECCRRVAGVVKIIDEVEVAPAIIKFPGAVQIAAETTSCKQGRHNASDCRGNRPFNRVAASKPATDGTIAANHQPRLLVAA